MRPFVCLVAILNIIDHLGKFDGKADEGLFVGYSLNSKAFRVFNSRTRIIEENLHIRFGESTPNVIGSGPDWLFDSNALTRTMNYEPIVAGTQSNGFADLKSFNDDGSKPSSDDGKKVDKDPIVNTASTNPNVVNAVSENISIGLPFDLNMPALEDVSIFNFLSDDEDDGYTQEEGIDHDEVFAPVARIKAIRLFLAYVSFKDFMVYQMDVKSAFLYGKIEEDVYLCQPLGFEDLNFPDRVYKVEKALYGQDQAPRAWKPTRKDTQVPQPSGSTDNVADEAVHKELGNSLVRATTTASSLEAKQDSGAKKPWDILLLKLEPVKPKKKDQIKLDEEAALKLQVEFNEEERLARERAKKEQ
nr:retrovirus-related Pol polyprotein from transposon TNT 1-94 [Tanacetum cinerariifolium]